MSAECTVSQAVEFLDVSVDFVRELFEDKLVLSRRENCKAPRPVFCKRHSIRLKYYYFSSFPVFAMNRLSLLLSVLCLFVFVSETISAAKKPNVLILMTDQHHADWVGCLGKFPVKTPNLDRLAAEGTLFTRSFVPVTFCSPTRIALLTGQYPSTLKIDRNLDEKTNDPLGLRDSVPTFHQPLFEAGYKNHHIGKWHAGQLCDLSCFQDAENDMTAPGRRFNQGRRAAGDDAFDPQRPGEVDAAQNIYRPDFLTERFERFLHVKPEQTQNIGLIGRHRIKDTLQYESVLADYCIDLIREHHRKNEPFAITYSVGPPHACNAAPLPYYDMYDPKTLPLPKTWNNVSPLYEKTLSARFADIYGEEGLREYLRCYSAQVSMVDAYIGRILDALRDEGILDNTLIVFLSDHGNLCGQHGMMDKACGAFYDDLCRVPTIVRLPGAFPAGKREDRFITSMDVAPTILDCLGVKPLENIVGKSFRNMANGGEAIRDTVYGERGGLPPKQGPIFRMIRTDKWKLILGGTGSKELYDLVADPDEVVDLSTESKHAAVVADLTSRLVEHMNRIDDPGRSKYQIP